MHVHTTVELRHSICIHVGQCLYTKVSDSEKIGIVLRLNIILGEKEEKMEAQKLVGLQINELIKCYITF